MTPVAPLSPRSRAGVDVAAADMDAVDAVIRERLRSDVVLVDQIAQYIVGAGGKRIRPRLVLLFAAALGFDGPERHTLAAVVEFIHTATLLHDDVVDRSQLRRGRATANATWGNAPSVLVGDFLYSRAFQLMVGLGSMEIMAILSDATNTIAEGEVMQLANVGNADLTEAAYREVIRCKTALLFQAAAHTAGVLAGPPPQADALKRYGLHFGLAYQLLDDWLDYAGDAALMGKNVGDDLAEGKMTLPLIIALRGANPADAAIIRRAVTLRAADAQSQVIDIVARSGALEATRAAAVRESECALAALTHLPAGQYRDALEGLARHCLTRLG